MIWDAMQKHPGYIKCPTRNATYAVSEAFVTFVWGMVSSGSSFAQKSGCNFVSHCKFGPLEDIAVLLIFPKTNIFPESLIPPIFSQSARCIGGHHDEVGQHRLGERDVPWFLNSVVRWADGSTVRAPISGPLPSSKLTST